MSAFRFLRTIRVAFAIGSMGALAQSAHPMAGEASYSAKTAGNAHVLLQGQSTGLLQPSLLWGAGDNTSGELGGEYPVTMLHAIASNVTKAAASGDHSLYVKADGTLWAMGTGIYARGSADQWNYYPQAEQIDTGVVDVVTSGHTLYLKTDGSLWGMGPGDYGQLGTGIAPGLLPRVQIAENVSAIGAGATYSVYLTANGELWASGTNAYGQFGDGTTTARGSFSLMATGVTAFAAGGLHIVYLKADGTLWGAGYNVTGALGDGSYSNRSTPVLIASEVGSVTAGASHTLYVKTDGTLWGTGSNTWGQLGDGTLANRNVPIQIATGVARAMAGPSNISFFVKTDGTLWAMGRNDYGQCGLGTVEPQSTPAQVATDVTLVAAGEMHSLFVKTDGHLLSVGRNQYGQLGNGVMTYRADPLLLATDAVAVAPGSRHTLFIRSDGTLWGVGRNDYGQLGAAAARLQAEPLQLATGVEALAAAEHSLFVKTDGTLWGMGLNNTGQLGLGHTDNVLALTQIGTGVAKVAVGNGHSLYLKTDGTLWGMGYNNYGQLGDGSQIQRTSPVPIATDVSQISANSYHSLFVKHDGSLWAMGRNSNGQLGDGSTATRTLPVPVDTGVVSAVAGLYYSVYIKQDGSLWGMGSSSGLGTGDILQPVQLATGVKAVAAGESYLMILKTDGSLMHRGMVTRGEKGLGQILESSTGTIQPVNPIAALVAGFHKTFFLQSPAVGGKPPVVERPPVGGNFVAGSGVQVPASALNDSFVSYQWRKDGVPIPGARRSWLYLPDFQSGDTGNYDVVMTNAAGSVTTAAESLALDPSTHPATIYLYNYAVAYDGSPKPVMVQVFPDTLAWSITYNGSATLPTAVGSYYVEVTVNDAIYSGSVHGFYEITKAAQTISFTGMGVRPFTADPITLDAFSSSGLPLTYVVVSGPATIAGNQLTLTGAGIVTVRAMQAGNESYLPAADVERTLTVRTNALLWQTEHFSAGEIADPNVSGLLADPDHDGLANLLEYALGLDPRSAAADGLPAVSVTATDWVFQYTRPADRDDIYYIVQMSTDLTLWQLASANPELVSEVDGIQTCRVKLPIGTGPNVYFRLRVFLD